MSFYVTIKIAESGTPMADGSRSAAGHMWIVLTDSNGTSESYGFAPGSDYSGQPAAPGQIYTNDDANYTETYHERRIEISESQYQAIRDFATDPISHGFSPRYNAFTNSCIDFVWSAISAGGLNPQNHDGAIWPTWNRQYIEDAWNRARRDNQIPGDWEGQITIDEFGRASIVPICRPPRAAISSSINSSYASAVTWRPRDPLAIDLDGDGIETVGVGSNPVLFDHNADGIRTGTGWLRGDDAWLALDRDGNGVIDSGRELFGVDTLITDANGQTRTARDGFEALRSVDSNGDGVFDANDEAFSQVRLWRDLNQDGISQANELSSLADHGIVSIGLTPTNTTSTNLGNGNTITARGTVTRTDGSTAQSGTVAVTSESAAANLDLANNPFYREFTDTIPLTEAARTLPGMRASGVVRDLGEAMSLGTAAAQDLTRLVQDYAAASTRAEQKALLDSLISAWARTADHPDSFARRAVGQWRQIGQTGNAASMAADFEARFGEALDAQELIWRPLLEQMLDAGQTPAQRQETFAALSHMMRQAGIVYAVHMGYDSGPAGGTYLLYAHTAWEDFARAEPEMARRIAALEAFNGQGMNNWMQHVSTSGGRPSSLRLALRSGEQTNLLNHAYDALAESVYGGLILQTRLKPYVDAISLTIDEDGIRFDIAGLHARLEAQKSQDHANALIDLIELNRYAQPMLQAVGYEGISTLRAWIDELAADSPVRQVLSEMNVLGAASTTGSASADMYFGNANTNTFNGGNGDDLIDGGAGSDYLYGDNGNDWLLGGEGNDTLHGGTGNDHLIGGEGNDYLYGDTTYGRDGGNDILDGGAGNDHLVGGYGSDTYLFGIGDGQDTINNGADLWNGTADPNANKKDVLQFKAGVSASDVSLSRSGDNLILRINGTTDQVTVQSYFANDGLHHTGYAVDEIRFADGTAWSVSDVKAMALQSTSGADNLTGYATDDTINGGDGNDVINGDDGNDRIEGGDGNDRLSGDMGDDVLVGGGGFDELYGGSGNDTLTGGDGDDRMFGGVGHDVYTGGGGNEYLWDASSVSNDVYHFGAGDGSDVIDDYGGTDAIILGPGITEDGLRVRSTGAYLEFRLNSGEKVTVWSMFDESTGALNGNKGIESIVFSDGTQWGVGRIRSESLKTSSASDVVYGFENDDVLDGGDGDDRLYGRNGNDTLAGGIGHDRLFGGGGSDSLSGGDGDDSLYGNEGSDELDGGSGHDTLYGDTGSDILRGGEGADTLYGGDAQDFLYGGSWNDRLEGGSGDDVYGFGRGDGHDTIYDYSGSADRIELGEGISEADVTLRNNGSSLVLTLNTGESLTVSGMFSGSTGAINANHVVESIVFADGTSWDVARMRAETLRTSAGADTIYATEGNDTLDGGEGNDTLRGLDGNDTLLGGSGTDTLHGDAGDDILDGGEGNDTLYGGEGNDVYIGGAGNDGLYDYSTTSNDVYRFGRGDGQDTIVDYGGSADRIELGSDIAADQLWFQRSGSSLVVSVIGTTDRITVNSWYSSDAYKVETLQLANGQTLASTQVQALVDAMASFAPPAAGQTTLPPNYQSSLGGVIASSWN